MTPLTENVRYVALFGVDWGFGSETFDFHYVCCIMRGQKILRRLPFGRLTHGILGWFMHRARFDYGHGYERRNMMYSDLDHNDVMCEMWHMTKPGERWVIGHG